MEDQGLEKGWNREGVQPQYFPLRPRWKHVCPEGPKIKKFEISSEIENFEREWNFRASHPPRPYVLWGNRSRVRKGAGGKGARVINCHNFFFTPDRETRSIDHTTTEGTAERKMRQFATPAPFTPAPFRPFWIETSRLKFSSDIKTFDRDSKFRARLNFFDRWALWALHSKTAEECNSSSTTANYCVTWTIARAIATEDNYCGDSPCGIHPLSELPRCDFRVWGGRGALPFESKFFTGSLVIIENLFPETYRYCYRLEIPMNYHYRYRLGPRSRPFISIDSQLPSRKSFELIFSKLPLPLPSWNV